MGEFRREFETETREMDQSVESAGEFRTLLARLREDDLPRFEERFKELLNQNTIREIANFNAYLNQHRETIRERVDRINQSLVQIDYNPGRVWERGDLLSDSLKGSTLFPLRIPLRPPTSGDISADFSTVRDWIVSWRGQSAIHCEYTKFNHRLFGANEMPAAAIFPDTQFIVHLLGIRREWETFHALTNRIVTAFPELLHWLVRRPMLALELAPDW